MKKIIYNLLMLLGIFLVNSCEEIDNEVNKIADGDNVAVFERYTIGLPALADGSEYTNEIPVKITGPNMDELSGGDITVTVEADASSTAVEGKHYRIENKTVTLAENNNYLNVVEVIMMSEGNTPPMDGTPEFAAYEAPILNLNIVSATGDPTVVATGKYANISLNFTPPNPYAGDYDAHLIYRHPSLGDYPDNVYVDEVNEKTLIPVTGRKCETGFATWGANGQICWITVNADNSIKFEVADTWDYDVKLGDPNDASLVSHFDPETGVIYLYYYYTGSGGDRIFWEVFTPKF